MKIRHKQSGVELEGVRDSGPDFVEGASVIQPSSIYSKEHWEAVPEWVDVTGECGFDACRLVHWCKGNGPVPILDANGCAAPHYRLRLVERNDFSAMFRHAFIVERKA